MLIADILLSSISILLANNLAICPEGGVIMKKYDVMFIVKPDLEEGAIKEVFDSSPE